MKGFKYNRWLVLVIVIGLLAALVIGFQRHAVERANRQVDLAIDYEGLQELAQREGLPERVVLEKAKETGITSLAVYETTFKKLNDNGKAAAIDGSKILESYHAGTLEDLPGASSWPLARLTARKSTSSVTIHRPIEKSRKISCAASAATA